MQRDKTYAKTGEIKIIRRTKNKIKMCKLGDYCLKRILYFLLCFCSLIIFISPFLHILYPLAFHFYPSKAVDRQPKANVLFEIFQPANVFIVIFNYEINTTERDKTRPTAHVQIMEGYVYLSPPYTELLIVNCSMSATY